MQVAWGAQREETNDSTNTLRDCRDPPGMTVVHEKVASQSHGTEVVDTARTVGDITHYNSLYFAKRLENVLCGPGIG